MQVSMVALWANGYRLLSTSGHHMTMIQSLVTSVGLDTDQMRVLDSFRIKRNAISYSGEDMDESSVAACIVAAEQLMCHVQDWLGKNRPDLIA